MMYYDRTLPDGLVRILRDHDFFNRLVTLTRSPWGAEQLAHIEFRRSRSQKHKRGAVKLYFGRSAVLEVIAGAKFTFTLSTDRKYTQVAPELFGPRFSAAGLDEVADPIEAYLRAVAAIVSPQFTAGEGQVHAGFVRRYGQGGTPGDLFLAVDKEIRVGFGAKTETEAFAEELRDRFGTAHRELDSIGILADGNIAAVELKNEKESIEVAARQVATHVLTFQRLTIDQRQRDPDFSLGGNLNKLVEQKIAVGLLPGYAHRAKPEAEMLPVIAAPDRRPGWQALWRSDLVRVLEKHGDLLAGLQLWKLSPEGEVEDVVTA